MNAETLAPLVEPLALAGTAIALLIATSIVWRYRNSPTRSRLRRRRNWRLMQVCALTSLFYLALAASSLVLKDLWGWLYLMLAIQAGTWWLRRFLTQRPMPALRR